MDNFDDIENMDLEDLTVEELVDLKVRLEERIEEVEDYLENYEDYNEDVEDIDNE